jgi:hypothetical protein
MNKTATALLTMTAGVLLAVAPMSFAHADEIPVPAPATYDETLEPVLDCVASTLTYTTIHWTAAAELIEGEVVYGEWVEESRSFLEGRPDYGVCPEWALVADEEGAESWVYTPPVVTPAVDEPVVVDEPTETADGGDNGLTPEQVAEFFRTA